MLAWSRLPLVVAVVAVASAGCADRDRAAAPPPPTFAPTRANSAAPPGPAPEGMVWIPGGEFSMGLEDAAPGAERSDGMADARPIHRVYVDGLWMDRTEVTNADFAAFVRATGYITVAERTPRASDFPGAPPENLFAGSVVFTPPRHPVPLDTHFRWWSFQRDASWRHPFGPGSDLEGRERFPVVHIAYDDAVAYAHWAGKRLPTEAEHEFAARGGLSGRRYAWGNELRPGGRWMANTFQGHFPDFDSGEDGAIGINAVAGYPPNGYGLYDITGNVWEWCSDWYRPDTYTHYGYSSVTRNPTGPERGYDPVEPAVPKRVQRGGSFLCSSQYCARYLVGARGKGEPSTGSNHVGFRCVRSR
jgi:formylglycine-generating enzyme required for sulfatase activity